jgi:coenzyme F420-reducing hydrogenase alpha subunit
MKIDIHYIARVEGEGSVKFEISDGKLRNLRLNIWEPPRFFEGFLVGRKFDEVPDIVSRICGICPVSHMTTSINALEKAMGILPSPEIRKLRTIMELSQIAASHIVHIYALVLPDYHGLDMLSGLDNEIRRLIRMKEAVNGVTALFGGRALHPVSMVVGGFTKIPPKDEIAKLIEQLEGIKDDALETVKMVSGLACPEFRSDVEYVALVKEDEYAVNEGMIATSSGLKTDLSGYYSFFEENQVPYANAKRTTMKGKRPIMVGALSRLHMKFDLLHPAAKKAAASAGFGLSDNNPFFNIMAQAIEVVHCISACSELMRSLDCRETLLKVMPKEGAGAAMTEAPRGLLYHEYQVNKRGVIEKANLVTPTAYNFQGLEENLKKMVRDNIDTPADELALLCEMLVRAYDPCFSCSVH